MQKKYTSLCLLLRTFNSEMLSSLKTKPSLLSFSLPRESSVLPAKMMSHLMPARLLANCREHSLTSEKMNMGLRHILAKNSCRDEKQRNSTVTAVKADTVGIAMCTTLSSTI